MSSGAVARAVLRERTDKVLEACAIGVPDSKRGETVKVFVVVKPGETLTAQEITDYCRERLAPYKVPKTVEFLKELPRTSVGKPDRKELRKIEEARRK
jgi:long-chain acyl-CoA synthetase